MIGWRFEFFVFFCFEKGCSLEIFAFFIWTFLRCLALIASKRHIIVFILTFTLSYHSIRVFSMWSWRRSITHRYLVRYVAHWIVKLLGLRKIIVLLRSYIWIAIFIWIWPTISKKLLVLIHLVRWLRLRIKQWFLSLYIQLLQILIEVLVIGLIIY